MVTTRSQLADAVVQASNERVRAGLKLSAVLMSFILLVAYGPKAIVGTGHQVTFSQLASVCAQTRLGGG